MESPAWITVDYLEGAGSMLVAVVRLARAPVNALNIDVKEQLIATARELATRADVGAVVVTGTGHFSAGDDIKEMAGLDRGFASRGLERISEAVAAVAAIPVPVVAAVTGYALGGGCELALAADFRVAAVDATLGLPEIHLGLIPGGGGTQRLARLIGVSRAKRLIYFGETINGRDAVDWGLVDEAVPGDRVEERAVEMARELARRAPVALRAAKRAIDVGIERDLESGLSLEEALFASVFATQDAEIGLASFVANGPRAAEFEGR